MLEERSWRSWPVSGAGSAAASDSEAEAFDSPQATLEGLVGRATSASVEWGVLEKTAASSITRENIWRHPDAHPLVLFLLAVDRYGQEFAGWLPETIEQIFRRDKIAISQSTLVKLLGMCVLVQSPSPWRQWEVFHWVCRALAGQEPNFTYLEEPELGHLVVGVDIMKVVDPQRPTGLEVDKYVAASLANQGIRFAPAPLDFADRALLDPKLQCSNCGTIGADNHDVKCVACGSPKLHAVPSEFAEIRAQQETVWQEKHTLPLVQAVESLPDTGAGNAVYRLLVNWDYAKTVRSQLIAQLRAVA